MALLEVKDEAITAKAYANQKLIMDLEDFVVSNLLLPLGSLIYVLFCVSRYGWGWDKYFDEVNTGKGIKIAKWLRPYFSYVLPIIIIVVLIMSVM